MARSIAEIEDDVQRHRVDDRERVGDERLCPHEQVPREGQGRKSRRQGLLRGGTGKRRRDDQEAEQGGRGARSQAPDRAQARRARGQAARPWLHRRRGRRAPRRRQAGSRGHRRAGARRG